MESIALAPPPPLAAASGARRPSLAFLSPPNTKGAATPSRPRGRWKASSATPTLPPGLSGDAEDPPNETTDDSATTVRVRFVLRKECRYGEQFFLVGDAAALGLWDPSLAVPLEWSDGHLWLAELDLPIGVAIQFKFVLRELSGGISWQPGPDRVLQTWKTVKTIVVSEDWDMAEDRKITEEQRNSSTAKVHNDEGENGIIVSTESQKKGAVFSTGLEEGYVAEPDGCGIGPGLAPTPEPILSSTLPSSKLHGHAGKQEQEERVKPSEVCQQEAGIHLLVREGCTGKRNESTATHNNDHGESQDEGSTAICSDKNVVGGPTPVVDEVKKDIQWGQRILRGFLHNLGLFQQGST